MFGNQSLRLRRSAPPSATLWEQVPRSMLRGHSTTGPCISAARRAGWPVCSRSVRMSVLNPCAFFHPLLPNRPGEDIVYKLMTTTLSQGHWEINLRLQVSPVGIASSFENSDLVSGESKRNPISGDWMGRDYVDEIMRGVQGATAKKASEGLGALPVWVAVVDLMPSA
jgi:hypothetical protein